MLSIILITLLHVGDIRSDVRTAMTDCKWLSRLQCRAHVVAHVRKELQRRHPGVTHVQVEAACRQRGGCRTLDEYEAAWTTAAPKQ